MADCVVCGEASEGKPLYKKLGNGDHSVDVFDALKDLELMILDDSAKTSSYICWECDDLVNEEYGRYVKDNGGRPVKGKAKKKGKKSNATDTPKSGIVPPLRLSGIHKNMIKTTPATAKKKAAKVQKTPKTPQTPQDITKLSKWKQKEIERTANRFHASHCLMCGNEFENRDNGFWRYSLKKVVFDGLDIAQVMEALGMARQVTLQLKGKRFVCCSCFYTIRRSYKTKQMKGTTSEVTSQPTISFHRASAEEHAAEIAKLLPPELAACYNIGTPTNEKQSNISQKQKANGVLDTNEAIGDTTPVENGENISPETAPEEETVDKGECSTEGNNKQPVPGIEEETSITPITSPAKVMNDSRIQSPTKTPVTSKSPAKTKLKGRGRKKNILLPKRTHEHLNNSPKNNNSKETSACDIKGNIDQTCNICGISHPERPDSWWFNLNTRITDFESISVSVALKLLESSFSTVSCDSKSVCPSCFNRISDGFKFQVRQKIAEQKGVDISEVQLNKVKVRMLEPSEGNAKKEEKSSPSNSPISEGKTKNKERSSSADITEEKTSQNIKNEQASDCSIISANKACSKSPVAEENSSDKESTATTTTTRKRHLSAESDANVKKVEGNQKKSSLKRLRINNDYDFEDIIPKVSKTENCQSFVPVKSHVKSPIKPKSNVSKIGKVVSPNIKEKFNNSKLGKGASPNIKTNNQISCKSGNLKKAPAPENKFEEDTNFESEHFGNLSGYSSDENHEYQLDNGFKETNKDIRGKKRSRVSKALIAKAKATNPIVRLKNINEMLPCDAFDGGSVTVGGIQTTQNKDSQSQTNETKTPGICLACNYNYLVRPEFWRSIDDLIKPPKLAVSVKWACVALNQKLPIAKKKEDEKVCQHCFHLLQKKFQTFVQSKVARSYGVSSDDVCLDDFVISFDQTSMNIVAEPIPEDTAEVVDAKALGEQVLEVTNCLSIDDVVCGRGDQPLEDHQFTIALLLLLNEVRVQIGAPLGELTQWLGSLMPLSFKEEGLMPCELSVAELLRSLTKDNRTPNLQGLKQVIPKSAFISASLSNLKNDAEKHKNNDAEVNKESTTSKEDLKKEISDDKSSNELEKKSLDSFEYFLQYVNLDRLMNNTATPVAITEFKQHLLYSLWKYKLMIRAKDEDLMSWIQQLCPVSLNPPSVEKLVQAAKTLYDHMQENPDDHEKLNLPLLIQKSPTDTISKFETEIEDNNEQTLTSSMSLENSKVIPKKSELIGNNHSKSSSPQKGKNVKSAKRKRSLKGNEVASIKSHKNSAKITNSENDQLRVTNLEEQSRKSNDKKCLINKPSTSIEDSYLLDTSNNFNDSCKESLEVEGRQEKELKDRIEMMNMDIIKKSKSPSQTEKKDIKELQNNKIMNNIQIDEVEAVKITRDKPCNFVNKYDESEDDNSADNELALKVQELERQLKEVKQQNMKLLEITQKSSHINNNNHLTTMRSPTSAKIQVDKIPSSKTFGIFKEEQNKKVNIDKSLNKSSIKSCSTSSNKNSSSNNENSSSSSTSGNNITNGSHTNLNTTNDIKDKEKIYTNLDKSPEYQKHIPTPPPVKKKPKMLFEELMNYDA